MIRSPHWPRWIKASICVHFDQYARAGNLPLYIEGSGRDTDDKVSFTELRLDGPRITEQNKGFFCIEVDIDVLVDHKITKNDIYALERHIGTMYAGFTTDIGVFKLGDGPEDSEEQLGCLSLLPRATESVIITNFGSPNKDMKLQQATIEATYRMILT